MPHRVCGVKSKPVLRGYWTSTREGSSVFFIVFRYWISSHRRVDKGIIVRNGRINLLLFADYLVLLACSKQAFQHSLDRFAAACDLVGMKIRTEKQGGTGKLIHDLVKQTQVCVSFIVPWPENGSFQTPQNFNFYFNLFPIFTFPIVMNRGNECWLVMQMTKKAIDAFVLWFRWISTIFTKLFVFPYLKTRLINDRPNC